MNTEIERAKELIRAKEDKISAIGVRILELREQAIILNSEIAIFKQMIEEAK